MISINFAKGGGGFQLWWFPRENCITFHFIFNICRTVELLLILISTRVIYSISIWICRALFRLKLFKIRFLIWYIKVQLITILPSFICKHQMGRDMFLLLHFAYMRYILYHWKNLSIFDSINSIMIWMNDFRVIRFGYLYWACC